ncbi:MAG: SDR family NAD(P)-dependent oxidoreductase [Bacteroidota bacterium]
MVPSTTPTVLLIGMETRLGKLCQQRLLAEGISVLGVQAEPDDEMAHHPMDLSCEDSVLGTINRLAADGPIHAVVNVAGYGYDWEGIALSEVQNQLEKRFFGAVRVCKAILPYMQAQSGGLIIQAGNVGGGPQNGPLVPMYEAVRFAIHQMSDQLNQDLALHNIEIVSLDAAGHSAPTGECLWVKTGHDIELAQVVRRAVKPLKPEVDQIAGNIVDLVYDRMLLDAGLPQSEAQDCLQLAQISDN